MKEESYALMQPRPEDLVRLGEPHLRIGRLRIWVHGRQFPESADYWDANWLRVTAFYRSAGSWVCTTGPIIHGSELAQLRQELERLYATLTGTAALPCMEPNLQVTLKGNGRGQVEVDVEITPDHLMESHSFTETLDQTYLPAILQECDAILLKYPVKGAS